MAIYLIGQFPYGIKAPPFRDGSLDISTDAPANTLQHAMIEMLHKIKINTTISMQIKYGYLDHVFFLHPDACAHCFI